MSTPPTIGVMGSSRRHRWWLVVVVAGLGAGALFAWLTWAIDGPLVYLDELIYMDAATSLAEGDGLRFRDGSYGYGPVYPVLVAAVVRLFDDRLLAYHVALALNAFVVASSVVPIFLLARRVSRASVATAAALACLLLPCTFYAAYLMTDALGYVVALWAAVAIVRALERPTTARQALVLALAAFAVAVRPQLVLLTPAYLLAALLASRMQGLSLARSIRTHWVPVATVAGLGLVVLGAAVAGRGPDLLGSYGVLWSSYDPLEALRWTVYHVWDATLYVWILPAMLLPSALVELWRRGASDAKAAAMCAVTIAITTGAIVLVGVFSATPWAQGRLHDRYLIFVFPLWVVVITDWAARGAARTRRVVVASVALVAVMAILVPYRGLIDVPTPNVFDGVATTVWSIVAELVGVDGLVSAHSLLLVSVALAGACALLVGATGIKRALGVAVGLVAITAASQWIGAISESDRGTFSDRRDASKLWVDRAADGRRVTTLFVGTEACNTEAIIRAHLTTEFFNRSVGPLISIGSPYAGSGKLSVRADGMIVRPGGTPARAALVLAPPGLDVRGELLAVGTTSRLRLWRIDGPIALQGPGSAESIRRACPGL